MRKEKEAVTCCAVFNFSTNLTTLDKVCQSILYTFLAMLCASLRPIKKMQMVAVSLLKLHHFASILK